MIGHLLEVVAASDCGAEIWLDALPLLPGVAELAGNGVLSTFHAQNSALRSEVEPDGHRADDPRALSLFDPQTSGGLLFSVASGEAERALETLANHGIEEASVIGRMRAATPGAHRVRMVETSSG